MEQTQTFSFYRLGMLFKHDCIENYRQLLLSTGLIILALSVINILISITYTALPDDVQFNMSCTHIEAKWLIAAFIIFGFLAGASMFSSLRTPPGKLSTLMIPASQIEKFVERWLVVVPGYLITFTIGVMAAECIRIGFCDWVLGRNPDAITPIALSDIFDGVNPMWEKVSKALLGFLFIQSFFILGSVVWQKLSVIKTFWCLAAIAIIYGGAIFLIIYEFKNPAYTYFPKKMDFTDTNWIYAITAAITLFNYIITFVRFRESEIINRW